MENSATLANPDPVKRPVQCIQGIKKGFRLSFPAISPQSFRHLVQGLDRPFNVCSGCCG
jgi:hypothetical protein